MKSFLLTAFLIVSSWLGHAQTPTITGDTMLCPWTNGTASITTSSTYDTYQWYSKFWFEEDAEFMPVAGATGPSFTYDWYTYDQSLLKVVATKSGIAYESNIIQLDSYAFSSITYMTEISPNVVFDPETLSYLICEGDAITNTVNMPYTIVQWYKNGVAIPGATNPTYVITSPGEYYAIAAPQACPGSTETTLPTTVSINPSCTLQDLSPVIDGDVMLCPWSDGTASVTNNTIYDSYQWYYKYWFEEGAEFEPIAGATTAEFNYDWYTYDQAVFKLVVTLDGETYESNTIQVDSYNWASLTVSLDINEYVTPDDETQTFILCEGASFVHTLNEPYSANIQWYKDDEPIPGANSISYAITEAGAYKVSAAPGFCPADENVSTTLPVIVTMQDCSMGTTNPISDSFSLYPNPAISELTIATGALGFSTWSVYDITGKLLLNGTPEDETFKIDIQALESGSYILQLAGEKDATSKIFIKK